MKTILVPLDGTERSDEALPVIRSLVLAAQHSVHLLRVIPPFEHDATEREPLGGRDAPIGLRLEAAGRHLEEVTAELEAFGAEVTAEVRVGDVCETILGVAQQIGAGLIAMVTHGRSGPLRWLRGSVAESILRESPVPLLLLNADAAEFRNPGLPFHGRMLVALDGTEQANAILPVAADLAGRFSSHVTLLRCVNAVGLAPSMPPAPPVGIPAPTPYSELNTERAEASLYDPQAGLEAQGIGADIRVEIGRPARRILDVAEEEDVDLVAMTTHGRSGGERLLLGSVAESVLRDCMRPLLVLNTQQPEPAKAVSAG